MPILMARIYTEALLVLVGHWITRDLEFGYLKNMAPDKQFFSPRKIALARRNNGMVNLPC